MQLSNNPPPGLKEIYLAAKLNAKKDETRSPEDAVLSEEELKKLTREQELFRKAHPDLFETEETAVGQMVMLNGEEMDNRQKKKKARAGLFSFIIWVKKWWLPTAILVVFIVCFVRFPIPVHRKLPAIRLDHRSSTEDVLEIDGVLWQSFALASHFTGHIRTSAYDVRVKGRLSNQTKYVTHAYFYPYGDYSQAPKEFRDSWTSVTRNIPIVEGRFKKVILYCSGKYLVAPASDREEAVKILKDSAILPP